MKKPAAKSDVRITVVRGVEGMALYINDYRVAGPKPWGGGEIVFQFEADPKHIDIGLAHRVSR